MAEHEVRATAVASRAYDLAMSLVDARDEGADRLKMISLIQDYLKESKLVAGAELQADLLEAVLDAPDRQARREPAHRLRLAVPADSHAILTATLALVHLAETVPPNPLPEWAREGIEKLGPVMALVHACRDKDTDVVMAGPDEDPKEEKKAKRYAQKEPLSAEQLGEIAEFYGLELLEKSDDGESDGGASAGETVWIFPASPERPWGPEISFWHELGHILLHSQGAPVAGSMSTLSCEGAAWELGLRQAACHGRGWDYDSEEMQWAREQLATYA